MDYHTFAGKARGPNCSVTKMDFLYNQSDCRCWSALINQGKDNIVVTFSVNRSEYGVQLFDVFSSKRIFTDIEPEDIFDVIEMVLPKTEQLQTED